MKNKTRITFDRHAQPHPWQLCPLPCGVARTLRPAGGVPQQTLGKGGLGHLTGVLCRHYRVPAACGLHRTVGHKGKAMLPQPAAQLAVPGGRHHDKARPAHGGHPRRFLNDLPSGLCRHACQHNAAHLPGRQHRKTVAGEASITGIIISEMIRSIYSLSNISNASAPSDALLT